LLTRRFPLLRLALILSLLLAVRLEPASAAMTANAPAPPAPRTPPYPPITPPQPAPELAEASAGSLSLQLPPLKAVLLVGPIDGDTGSGTMAAKQDMDLAASELAANGVTVYKFYTPNNDWAQIRAAASGAHFLFYRGHGIYWSPMPYPEVGGFALKDNFVSSATIRNDLKLAPNAIVMLYACFSAGSSSNDPISVTSAEAQRRVVQYSAPFVDLGAAGYYADWYGNAFQMYVRYLFQGKTLGQAYETYFDFNGSTVERYGYPAHPGMVLWLDKDYWYQPPPQYNNAFVGQPARTLTELFRPPAMEVSPAALMALATPSAAPMTHTLSVTGVSTEAFTWTATLSGADLTWLRVAPLSGLSGEALTIAVTPTTALGEYGASLRIVASNLQLENADQTIAITLRVVEHVWTTYLPVAMR